MCARELSRACLANGGVKRTTRERRTVQMHEFAIANAARRLRVDAPISGLEKPLNFPEPPGTIGKEDPQSWRLTHDAHPVPEF